VLEGLSAPLRSSRSGEWLRNESGTMWACPVECWRG
jgi:hypothetical protein